MCPNNAFVLSPWKSARSCTHTPTYTHCAQMAQCIRPTEIVDALLWYILQRAGNGKLILFVRNIFMLHTHYVRTCTRRYSVCVKEARDLDRAFPASLILMLRRGERVTAYVKEVLLGKRRSFRSV